MYHYHQLHTVPQKDICDSAFYTSNPILYTTNAFDIAGCDISGVHQGALSKPTCLSTCRDLVEKLDAPLVFEYLLQNGVICTETAAAICSEVDLCQGQLVSAAPPGGELCVRCSGSVCKCPATDWSNTNWPV